MMQSFLEDGYTKVPAEFNGVDAPAYTDASLSVDWFLVNPLLRDEHVQKFYELVLAQLTEQSCIGKNVIIFQCDSWLHLVEQFNLKFRFLIKDPLLV